MSERKTNRKVQRTSLAVALALALGLTLPACSAAQSPTKPNILFILVDNLGYGELGVYGA